MFDNLNTPSDYFNFTLVTDYRSCACFNLQLKWNVRLFRFDHHTQCADNSSISSVYLEVIENNSVILNYSTSVNQSIQFNSLINRTDNHNFKLRLGYRFKGNVGIGGNISLRYVHDFVPFTSTNINTITWENITLTGNDSIVEITPSTLVGSIKLVATSNNSIVCAGQIIHLHLH